MNQAQFDKGMWRAIVAFYVFVITLIIWSASGNHVAGTLALVSIAVVVFTVIRINIGETDEDE